MVDASERSNPPPTETEANKIAGPDNAPTIFVDGMEGFIYDEALVKTNLFEEVYYRIENNQALIQRRVTAHLVMSHRAIDTLYDWLGRQIAARNEHFAEMHRVSNFASSEAKPSKA